MPRKGNKKSIEAAAAIAPAPVVEELGQVPAAADTPVGDVPADVVNDTNVPEVIVPEVEVVVETAPEPVQNDILELQVRQTREDKEGNKTNVQYAVRFELPKDKSAKLSYIVGTAVDTLTRKMRLWKDCKIKPLFDSRKPLEICIKSSQYVLDLGKADQVLQASLKVNSGIRSQLAFVNRMVAITNDMCTEIVPISVGELLANKGRDYQLTYGKEAPKGISAATVMELNRKEFVVTEKGELAEA